jgi:translation initiation factor 2 beta subunit (eIF-2beta)/eIF-5
MSSEPEYVICLQCETPTYQFEWDKEKLSAAVCSTCGNDEISEFMTEAELEEQSGS